MRILPLAAVAALAFGPVTAVQARAVSPAETSGGASVEVSVDPALQKLAKSTYGVRDVEALAAELKRDVEREIGRTGVRAGTRIELVLMDVKPNRPTFKQLGDTPGLSFESFSIGGARIEGRLVAPDGAVTPLAYAWYESDIRNAPYQSTWSDVHWTIDRFARRLARGETIARK